MTQSNPLDFEKKEIMKNRMLLALMDEYRKSTIPYKAILATLDQALFEKIVDKKTLDNDCKSIQTITFHMVQSGYTYANYINAIHERKWFEYENNIETPAKGIVELNKMLDYTESSFQGLWGKTNDELDQYTFKTRWNVIYDVEQILEHAIVHVLRHRRQVENMIKKMANQ